MSRSRRGRSTSIGRSAEEPKSRSRSRRLSPRLPARCRDLQSPPLPGELHLEAQGVVVGGGVIQAVGIDLATADDGWSVENFAAMLPGDTRVDLKGMLGIDPAPDVPRPWSRRLRGVRPPLPPGGAARSARRADRPLHDRRRRRSYARTSEPHRSRRHDRRGHHERLARRAALPAIRPALCRRRSRRRPRRPRRDARARRAFRRQDGRRRARSSR